MSRETAVLARLRAICLALPEASEVAAWGHPNFKAGKKTFAVFEKYQGEWVIAFKTNLSYQKKLVERDPRFYASPYIGKHGWVSMRIASGVDWAEVRDFVTESYRLVATKRMLGALQGAGPATARPRSPSRSRSSGSSGYTGGGRRRKHRRVE